MPVTQISYSPKYFDTEYEYRHVILPQETSRRVPKDRLMTEDEWRELGRFSMAFLYVSA